MILWVILSFPDSQQCDDTAIKADISALQTGKVDKVDSMGLISDSEKQRLSAVTNYDDTEIKTSLSALQTGKVDKVDGMGLISDAEKERLSAVTNYDDTEIKTSLSALQTILENAGKLGVPLPKKLKEVLIQLREDNND